MVMWTMTMDKTMQTNLLKASLSVVMEAPVGLTASLVPGVSATTCKGLDV